MQKTREQRIRERAYAIWQREGESHGLHEAHWRQAELEINEEDAATQPATAAPPPVGESEKPMQPPKSKSLNSKAAAAPDTRAESRLAAPRRSRAAKKG